MVLLLLRAVHPLHCEGHGGKGEVPAAFLPRGPDGPGGVGGFGGGVSHGCPRLVSPRYTECAVHGLGREENVCRQSQREEEHKKYLRILAGVADKSIL